MKKRPMREPQICCLVLQLRNDKDQVRGIAKIPISTNRFSGFLFEARRRLVLLEKALYKPEYIANHRAQEIVLLHLDISMWCAAWDGPAEGVVENPADDHITDVDAKNMQPEGEHIAKLLLSTDGVRVREVTYVQDPVSLLYVPEVICSNVFPWEAFDAGESNE